jgi:hypothetical protein
MPGLEMFPDRLLGFRARPSMELHVRVLWRLTLQSFIDGKPGHTL